MTYPGGKSGSGVYQQIINQFPPHSHYIEAFLGSGAIMRYKKPAISSIGIDIDGDVISSFETQVPGLKLVCGDAVEWLTSAAIPDDALVYLDPPYLMTTRSTQRKIYPAEFGEVGQHRRLLRCIRNLTCRVAISGYWSDLYADQLADWRTIHYPTMTRGGRVATEWLWMNYLEPWELHDYRYLGKGFRERERIQRKKQRWLSRLKSLPALERMAILSAIEDLRSAGNIAGSDGSGSAPAVIA